ncbi:MAG: hypothetical protein ACLQUY_15215 [Ktedonobacterales bacterium]
MQAAVEALKVEGPDAEGYTENGWRRAAYQDAHECATFDFRNGRRYDDSTRERAESLALDRFADLTVEEKEVAIRKPFWPAFEDVFEREYVAYLRELTQQQL